MDAKRAPAGRMARSPGSCQGRPGEAGDHREAGEPQREAVARERPGHPHEGHPLPGGDLPVVERVADEDHLGAAGQSGVNGNDGAPGHDGKDGAQGPQGAPGQDGKAGPQGPPISTKTTVVCVDPNGASGKATLVIGATACVGKTQLTVFVPAS